MKSRFERMRCTGWREEMRTAAIIMVGALSLLLPVATSCGGDDSATEPDTQPPQASDLAAEMDGDDVDLTWTMCTAPDFHGYALYRSEDSDIGQDPLEEELLSTIGAAADTTYTDESPFDADTLYYVLRTSDDAGNTAWSNEVPVSDDSPGGGGGELPVVQNLRLYSAACEDRTVVLEWDAVTGEDVDGYEVRFDPSASGTYSSVGQVTGTTYNHTADQAGQYVVLAYRGDDYSSGNSNVVSTMPVIITTTYSIYDNFAPASYHTGFIFGFGGGQTGQASSPGFVQDIYAYDPTRGTDGDDDVYLYSGDYGAFGNGNATNLTWSEGTEPAGYPTNPWTTNFRVYSNDVIFCELYDGYYAKMLNMTVQAEPQSQNGTEVRFTYEIQGIQGLYLFTNDRTN